MVTAETSRGEQDLTLLFTRPLRWGYEYVKPAEPVPSPERAHTPQQRGPRMVPRAQAAGLGQAAILTALGAVAVLILDNVLGVFAVGGVSGISDFFVLLVNAGAGVVAYRAAQAWQLSRPRRGSADSVPSMSAIQRYGIPGVNAFAAFLMPYVVLPVEAVVAWARIWRGKHDLVPDPSDRKQQEAEYIAAFEAWQQRIKQFEDAEIRRYETVDLWYPVGPSSASRMVCVFGGTHISWAAALSTLGATLLGSGASMLIGDLSRRQTTDPFADLCREVGVPVTAAVLPADARQAALFAGMSWSELSTILVEVLHSANDDLNTSRRERQEDRAVIREIAGCLDDDGAVSIARLRQALLVIEGADVRTSHSRIAVAEYDRLASLYNDVQREHGGVMQRVTRVERALRDFEILHDGSYANAALGPHAAIAKGSRLVGGGDSSLQIIEIDKRADDLDNDRLVDVLFQLLLRRVRTGASHAEVLVILGADRIRRDALESLMTHAQQDHVGMVLFFEHLRQDAIEIVGGGGASAAFLALGNHREAKEASEFIGADYKWVESQRTRSDGDSLTKTWGKEASTSSSSTRNFPTGVSFGETVTRGRSYSEAFGHTTDSSVSDQRVREAVIEPEVLMGLPVTGMISVEVLPGGRRITKNLDCFPQRRFLGRVATEVVPPSAAA